MYREKDDNNQMITLLYHARANGAICKRIAAESGGVIQALCDKDQPIQHLDGMLVRWDSRSDSFHADKEVNSAAAVILSRNKRRARMALEGICPATWFVKRDCQFPCVVRPKRHFGGHNFFLCNNQDELVKAIRRFGAGGWYASEFIAKSDEFRIFVINGEAFKIVRRYRKDADPTQPWNAHNGGLSKRIKPENWPAGLAAIAESAAEKLGLDLCAVDVIAKDAKQYVLEANTAPGLERQGTIRRFAKLLMEMA